MHVPSILDFAIHNKGEREQADSNYLAALNDNAPLDQPAPILRQPVPHGIYHLIPENTVLVEYHCNTCNGVNELQVNFMSGVRLREGCIAFPENNQLECVHCGTHHDLTDLRKDVEMQFGGSHSLITQKEHLS